MQNIVEGLYACVFLGQWSIIATYSQITHSMTTSWFRTVLVVFCSIQTTCPVSCLSEPYLSRICRHIKGDVALSIEWGKVVCVGGCCHGWSGSVGVVLIAT